MISQIVATIAGADQYIFHLTNGGYTTPLLDRVMTFLSWSGNLGVIWLALLGAVALLGKKTGRRIALVGLGALAIGFFASEIIKEITMRPRPFLSLDEARRGCSSPLPLRTPSPQGTRRARSPWPRGSYSVLGGCWAEFRFGPGVRSLSPPRSPTPASTSASTGPPTCSPA